MINEIKTSDSLLCVSEHIDEYHSHYVINNYADDTNELQRCQLYPGAVKFKNGSWEIWTGTDWVFFIPKDEKSYDIVTSPRLLDVVLWAEEKMIKEQKIDTLCEKYPALKDAKDQYETVLALVADK